jgi:GTP cyclohydrolase II
MFKELGIGTVRLMTNNPEMIAALSKAGLEVISDHRVLVRPTAENISRQARPGQALHRPRGDARLLEQGLRHAR